MSYAFPHHAMHACGYPWNSFYDCYLNGQYAVLCYVWLKPVCCRRALLMMLTILDDDVDDDEILY